MEIMEVFIERFKTGFSYGLYYGAIALIPWFLLRKVDWHFFWPDTRKAKRLLSCLGFKDQVKNLNKYELAIASQLVNPNDIDVTFEDIAGIEQMAEQIRSNIIFPLLTSSVLSKASPFFEPPKGVLLYGPPGCGKTMIAKATAKEAKARFINLEVPVLTDKWYGESQKLSAAVFTLAEKLQPCIIFIDEIDTFLRSRGENDHEATAMMKAQFMILWDGLQSKRSGVVVFGATNRPNAVDVAILRRMPVKVAVPLPNREQRVDILRHLLAKEPLESDIDLDDLAQSTDGFAGSDLKELCRRFVCNRLAEGTWAKTTREEVIDIISNKDLTNKEEVVLKLISGLRRVSRSDFQTALDQMKSSRQSGDNENNTENNCEDIDF